MKEETIIELTLSEAKNILSLVQNNKPHLYVAEFSETAENQVVGMTEYQTILTECFRCSFRIELDIQSKFYDHSNVQVFEHTKLPENLSLLYGALYKKIVFEIKSINPRDEEYKKLLHILTEEYRMTQARDKQRVMALFELAIDPVKLEEYRRRLNEWQEKIGLIQDDTGRPKTNLRTNLPVTY